MIHNFIYIFLSHFDLQIYKYAIFTNFITFFFLF